MSAPGSLRALRLGGALLVVIFGIWAGFRVHLQSTGRADDVTHPGVLRGPAGVHVPVGEASAPIASDLDGFDPAVPSVAKIPEHLPDFSLKDLAGKATPIAAWAGKSLILNFWATWCAPCRREIPLLETLNDEWRGRNVEVVGVAVDYADKVAAYANDLKIAYPLLVGEEDALDVATQLGVSTPVFPFTVFTDDRGDVVALYVGELHRAQADLILSVVRQLDLAQVELPAARRSIAAGLQALAAG